MGPAQRSDPLGDPGTSTVTTLRLRQLPMPQPPPPGCHNSTPAPRPLGSHGAAGGVVEPLPMPMPLPSARTTASPVPRGGARGTTGEGRRGGRAAGGTVVRIMVPHGPIRPREELFRPSQPSASEATATATRTTTGNKIWGSTRSRKKTPIIISNIRHRGPGLREFGWDTLLAGFGGPTCRFNRQ